MFEFQGQGLISRSRSQNIGSMQVCAPLRHSLISEVFLQVINWTDTDNQNQASISNSCTNN